MIKGVFKHFDVLNCLYHEILKHVNLIESVFFRTDLFGLKFHSDLCHTTVIAIQFDEQILVLANRQLAGMKEYDLSLSLVNFQLTFLFLKKFKSLEEKTAFQ